MKSIYSLAVLVAAAVAPHIALAKNEKVDLCHQTGNGSFVVLNIPVKAANSHIRSHGDYFPVTFYEDQDSDGFGNSDVFFKSCEDYVDGFSTEDGDLDDTNPLITNIPPIPDDEECDPEVDEECGDDEADEL